MLISGTPVVGPNFKAQAPNAVWSPSTKKKTTNLHLNLNLQTPKKQETQTSVSSPQNCNDNALKSEDGQELEESSPVWQPFGAPYEGRQFRSVKLPATNMKTITSSQSESPKKKETEALPKSPKELEHTSAEVNYISKDINAQKSAELSSNSSTIFTKTGWGSHLPPSQSPTITLLQKAREGQIPKGAIYIEEKSESTPIPENAVLLDRKVTVDGDKLHTDSYYAVPTLTTEVTTHNIKTPPKYDGIGPTEYGIPVALRTCVKEENASDWYKSMYKSLHRVKHPESNQTVHIGGYMSEPEYERKEKFKGKYANDYRKIPEKSITHSTQPMSPDKTKSTGIARHEPKREVYRVEPRSIAEYEPGRSSLAEREFQKFWTDFWDSMDDLQEHFGDHFLSSTQSRQQGLNKRWPNVLLSDGYESDSTLIRKTGRNLDVEPEQQKAWYKEIQKGGEIPLTGLRKSAPEKPTASPHQYQETEVNIHFKSPIRHLEKEYIEEEELKKRQEDAMRKLYDEERKKKQLQEMAEIEMRKHSDFFTPSEKSPISLSRYDNPFESDRLTLHNGPPPKTMARALYPFTAQTTRELSLNRSDIVYITKQIDRNWYEGEHHGLVGIFPVSYVEIIPNEKANFQPRKAIEGEAIVKFNFRAQTPLELSLFKGERVVLVKRMDPNWYEGRLGAKKGIFPVSYVEVLQDPGEIIGTRAVSPKPPASPIFGPIVNGCPPKSVEGPSYNTGLRPLQGKPPIQIEKSCQLTQSLHIDTYNEPIPYRSLYSYKPQNDDELDLQEGDTVYVMEKCDDGWYVGTSLRTGLFGTFPGNYVERI